MSNGKVIHNQTSKTKKANSAVKGSFPVGSLAVTPPPTFNDMYKGYFPLWRKITDWGWYKDSNTKAVFLHLLLTANHKDSDFLGHKIKEGQCVHGLIELSKILGLSAQSVRTSIKHLKSTNEITTKATNRFTIYTLTNYYKYLPKYVAPNKPANKQLTNNQQTTNKQLTTSNNDKNDKNNKKEKEVSLFWDYFLLKTEKAFKLTSDCKALITKRLKEGYSLDQLKKAVDNFVADTWEGRYERLDLIYCIGKQRGKPDALEKWLNVTPKNEDGEELMPGTNIAKKYFKKGE